jgi:hypothetical protein
MTFEWSWSWAAGEGWIHTCLGLRFFSNGEAMALHIGVLVGELMLQVNFAKEA